MKRRSQLRFLPMPLHRGARRRIRSRIHRGIASQESRSRGIRHGPGGLAHRLHVVGEVSLALKAEVASAFLAEPVTGEDGRRTEVYVARCQPRVEHDTRGREYSPQTERCLAESTPRLMALLFTTCRSSRLMIGSRIGATVRCAWSAPTFSWPVDAPRFSKYCPLPWEH
jgi:hypothetical protein